MATTVLLVDDHAIFRMGLKLLLANEAELQVIGEAGDGQAAITQVEELSPDVVIMDIAMPDMDGIGATRHIKSEFPQINIIALSIHDEKDFVEEMLGAGATGYVLKENAPEDLIPCIHTVRRGKVFLSASIKDVVVSQYMDRLADTGPLSDKRAHNSLLTTKIHRPHISQHTVLRTRLIEQLEEGRGQPLTLVSAPAGYGKSTLLSQWLDSCDCPSAWLSLDEGDNDLRQFLTYLVAAVRTQFPEALQDSSHLVKAPNLPTSSVLVRTLANDLARVPQRIILVLDDFHHIKEPSIHELIGELLRHPPQTVHLVLASRTDPSLDLLQLRAYRRMGEVRAQGLSFTVGETKAYLEKVVGTTVEERIAKEITEKTEGWVTGLHLITISMHDISDLANLSIVLPGEQQTLDYMAAVTLSRQPREVQAWLLKTSILDRFCAALCEAVCAAPDAKASPGEEPSPSIDGEAFLGSLTERNLFVIPLDAQGRWFRYHHMFQELLQRQLENAQEAKDIGALHARASNWFAENNLVDEALKHALAAGDVSNAALLVEKHRNQLMNSEQWHRLNSWLQMLPPETLKKNPKLLVTQAWAETLFFSQYSKWFDAPDQIADLLSEVSISSDEKTMISAEINALRTTLLYSTGEIDRALESAEQVMRTLHPESNSMRGQTAVIMAMAYQGKGKLDQALKTIRHTMDINSLSDRIIQSKMLIGLCIIHWLEGDLEGMKQPALQLLRLGEESDLPESISFARYFLGCFHYVLNELNESESHFSVVAENRYLAREHYHAQCVFGLALCKIAQGRNDQARQVVQSVIEYTLETNNTWLHGIARLFQAELALRFRQSVGAFDWTKVADHNFFTPMYVFYVPKLTAVKAMLTINTPESQKEAADLLDHLQNIVVSTHNTPVRIDVLALQALLHDVRGEQTAALEILAKSLVLAEPGGFIRNYVDLGPKMADLLNRLYRQGVAKHSKVLPYITQILTAFPSDESGMREKRDALEIPAVELVGAALTRREQQILQLLATSLSPDEIAVELTISVATVRTHTKRIYSKLDVHSRVEALSIARELDLL